MRRLVAFLLLFGSALALVLWLERRSRTPPPSPAEPTPAEATSPAAPEGAGEVPEELPAEELSTETVELRPPPPPEPEPRAQPGQGGPTGLVPGSRFELRGFSEGGEGENPVRFQVRAEDSSLAGENAWNLEGVVAELFDPLDGQRQIEVRARDGIARVETGDVVYEPRLQALELRAVEVTVERGAPVVPLEVRAPAVLMPIDSRQLVAPDEARISGEALSASGRDALLDLPAAQFSFRGGGEVDIDRAGGEHARLKSTGALRLYRQKPDAATLAPLFLAGTDGAEIELSGERETRMSAREILVRADDASGGGSFVVRSLQMEGDVLWNASGVRVSAQRSSAELDERGEPTNATFEGLPSVEVSLGAAEGLPSGLPLPEASTLRMAGEGPLEVSSHEGRLEMRLGGPTTAVTAGADLRAGGELRGWREADGRAGLSATGGVVLEGERSTLETTELDGEFITSAEGTPTDLRVETRGGARLVGTFGGGRSFTLSTPDRLIAERRGPGWRVVEATNVVLTIEGAEGPGGAFEARADRVRELDVASVSFLAEGNVSFQGPHGRGWAERVQVRDADEVRMEGSAERPARFEGPPGRIEALVLELREGNLSARGAVRAEVLGTGARLAPETADGRQELSADELDVAWRTEGERLSTLDLRARGTVRADGTEDGREWTIDSGTLALTRPIPGAPSAGDEDLLLVAEGSVRTTLRETGGSLELESARLEARREGPVRRLLAEGDVRYRGAWGNRFEGTAERVELDAAGRGRLVPATGERLTVEGLLGRGALPFTLTAAEIDLEEGRVLALEPDVTLRPTKDDEPVEIRARARRLRADESSIELEQEASIEGRNPGAEPWRLDADRVRFRGELQDGGDPASASLQAVDAQGNVRFELVGTASGYGDSIEGSPLGEMKLRGAPAQVESPLFRLEAEWIDFDPGLQIVTATGHGTILPTEPAAGEPPQDWRMHYLASRTLIEPDALVLVLQEPELEYPEEEARLRASWAALWLDRHSWERMPAELRGEEPEAAPRAPTGLEGIQKANLFARIQASQISRYLSEAYFEGPVELTQDDDLVLRAGALYLDTVAGHGWIVDATVNVFGRLVGLDLDKLIVKADWLRYSSDGSLRADRATVTPCDHAEPHVRIVTGDLRITPYAGRKEFELSLRDNRIELFGLLHIPLPPIRLGTDEEYEPLWQTLRLADSARFGTLVSAGISRPAEGIGKAMNRLFNASPFEVDANYKLNASWLGSRGILLDLGLEAESKGTYWLDMYLGGLPDRGEDRGFIRVDEGDRDQLRLWYRADGRWELGEKDQLDLSVSVQTDPGVQSEFFESDFLRYERDESFLRWTRASNGNFVEATVVPRLEGFRSQTQELPSLGVYGGRRPVAEIGGADVLYTGRADAAYLDRQAGDFGVQSPFSEAPPLSADGVFADGYGERDLLRLDTEHRLEVPVELGDSAVKATPFVGTRFTAWDEGVDPDLTPLRWRTEVGLRLATTFWKRTQAGLHQLVPFVAARGELGLERAGGKPVPIDSVEAPLDGSFVDFGFRSRFGVEEDRTRFDLEVVNTWGDGLADPDQDGWQPTAVFARVEFEPFGRPFELWHDGRHDLVDGKTAYSLVGIATRWNEDLRLQASHQRGRDSEGQAFFEAATLRGAYRWTEKWEFEGRQTISLLENDRLGTDFLIRRYGHDVVVEFETSFRAGEGSSFSVNIKPRFGFRPTRVGYLSY